MLNCPLHGAMSRNLIDAQSLREPLITQDDDGVIDDSTSSDHVTPLGPDGTLDPDESLHDSLDDLYASLDSLSDPNPIDDFLEGPYALDTNDSTLILTRSHSWMSHLLYCLLILVYICISLLICLLIAHSARLLITTLAY